MIRYVQHSGDRWNGANDLYFHALPFLIGVAYERIVNRFDALEDVRGNILGHLQKPF